MTEREADPAEVERLVVKANALRRSALRMIYQARSGHPGGSLSAAEIVAVLFGRVMRHDPSRADRDRFILSKGHAAPILYAALADAGYIAEAELSTLRQLGSRLQGHPCRAKTPGVEASGSLGQGLSIGCGLAYAAKQLDRHGGRVFVLLGDGELDEGQTWEAALFAAHQRLDNLYAVVDRNGLQYVAPTEELLALEPLAAKWEAFGWRVAEVADGHDVASLLKAFGRLGADSGAPRVVIARTVKGKGVSFMEHNPAWHGAAPDRAQFEAAMRELGGL